MDHDSDVVITDVYEKDNDICFVVSDVTKDTNVTDTGTVADEQPAVESKPESKPEPAKTQKKVSKQEPKPEPESVQPQEKIPGTNITEPISEPPISTSDDKIVVIEGKTYLLHDGKAYIVQ